MVSPVIIDAVIFGVMVAAVLAYIIVDQPPQ